MTLTFMVNTSLHWDYHGVDDISLWSFAIKNSTWLYNRVPNRQSGLTLLEFLTKTNMDHRDLLHPHVWGCLSFVIDAKLQNYQKIPKWNLRSRLEKSLVFLTSVHH